MASRVSNKLAFCSVAATLPILAQCRFPADGPGQFVSYTFSPVVTATSIVLHVSLEFQGNQEGKDEFQVPSEWAGETLHGVQNLHAQSANTVISDTSSAGTKIVRHPAGQRVVLAYDVVKDWTGRFRHPAEFRGTLMPDYLELTGDNALVRPNLPADAKVSAHFDWQQMPPQWVLATSFGVASNSEERCQSYSGTWSDIQRALFAAGAFRIHHFRIGTQPAVLAIRDQWTFSDEEAIKQVRIAVGVVREFWRDDNFPFYLVTLKQFDEDSGDGDGSAFTNAFWIYLSRKDSIVEQTPVLIHETFHTWDPGRMGPMPSPEDWKAVEWFREGFDNYYASLLALRAGTLQFPAYLESVNRDLRLFPSSRDPYVRGRVLALWLDWQVRHDSGGRHSSDTVMYDMVREAGQPLTEARVLHTADRYLSADSREKFARAIQPDSKVALDESALGPCARGSMDELPTFDLGFDLDSSRAGNSIAGVEPNGPAFQAGLRSGQRLSGRLSVNKNQPDKVAIVTIATNGGPKSIEYYPRGKSITVMQYHLDQAAYTKNPGSCLMK